MNYLLKLFLKTSEFSKKVCYLFNLYAQIKYTYVCRNSCGYNRMYYADHKSTSLIQNKNYFIVPVLKAILSMPYSKLLYKVGFLYVWACRVKFTFNSTSSTCLTLQKKSIKALLHIFHFSRKKPFKSRCLYHEVQTLNQYWLAACQMLTGFTSGR